MPIRFRCEHCGQLLGIASRKRGTAIACPRCQNSLIVPMADRVERPKPSTSARLFESNEFDRWIGKQRGSGAVAGTSGEATPILDFADLPESIVLDEESDSGDRADFSSEDSGIRRAYPKGPPIAEERRLRWVLGFAAIAIVIAFFAGVFVGRVIFPKSLPPIPKVVPIPENAAPAANTVSAENVSAAASGPVLTGNLRYRDNDTLLPDSGTSVIILPAGVEIAERISFDGLRPEDKGRQSRPGVDQLRRYGGHFDYVNEDGDFRIELTQPGKVWVLALSSHKKRTESQPVFAADRSVLNQYFSDARSLLDGRDYLLISRQIPDGPAQPVVHSF